MSYRVLLVFATSFVFASPRFTPAADDTAGGGAAPKKDGGQASKSTKDKDAGGGGAEKKETYAVVQIGDDVKVCKDSGVNALREKVNEDYKATLKAYEEAKKAALKVKKKFNDAKPVKPNVKTLATFLKSEEDASALRDKTVQKLQAQKKKDKEDHSKAK